MRWVKRLHHPLCAHEHLWLQIGVSRHDDPIRWLDQSPVALEWILKVNNGMDVFDHRVKAWQLMGLHGKGVANIQILSKLHIANMCHCECLLADLPGKCIRVKRRVHVCVASCDNHRGSRKHCKSLMGAIP